MMKDEYKFHMINVLDVFLLNFFPRFIQSILTSYSQPDNGEIMTH